MTEPEDRESRPPTPAPSDSGRVSLPPRLREKLDEAESGSGESKISSAVGVVVMLLVLAVVGGGIWRMVRSGQQKEKARIAAAEAAAAAEHAAHVADSLAQVLRADSLAAVARADSIAFAKLPKWQQRKILAERAKKASAASPASPASSAGAPNPAGATSPGSAASTQPAAGAGAAATHRSKAPDSAAAAAAVPEEGGPFGIDAGQFLDEARAHQVADDLKAKAGLSAQVLTVGEGDAATYHVFLGKFSTRSAAEAAATRMLSKGWIAEGAVEPLPKSP